MEATAFTNEDLEAAKAELERLAAEAEAEKQDIARIAKKHGVDKAYLIKVPLNDEYTEFAKGYMKYPAREDVSIAMTLENSDPLKGKEIVLRNNWLEGDERILEDTELFLSATTVLDTILSIRQALVKKN